MSARRGPQLRWRREPREPGLAGVCQGERGWQLRLGERSVACVAPLYKGFSQHRRGYYFYTLLNDGAAGSRNTAGEEPPFPDAEMAKQACMAWVRGYFAGNPKAQEAREARGK